jgi:competence ComEA-like helix-hairpin-helix protein
MQLIDSRITIRSPRPAGRSKKIALAGLALLLTVLPLGPGLAQEPQQPETRSPEDVKAEDTFVRTCIKCHTADRVVGSRRSRTQWEEVMTQMTTARGAIIPDEDWDVVQNYLVRHHGRVNVNRAPVNELVEVLAVTPETAENIVKYRKEHGDFVDFDAFAKVPGLDLAKLEKLRDAISF